MPSMFDYSELKENLKRGKAKLSEKEVLKRFRHVDINLAAKFIIDVQEATKDSKYSFANFPCPDANEYSSKYGLIYPSDNSELCAKVQNIIYYCRRGNRDGLSNIHACLLGTKYLLLPCDKDEYKLASKRVDGINPELLAFNPLLGNIISQLVELCIAHPNMPMEEAMRNTVASIPQGKRKSFNNQ